MASRVSRVAGPVGRPVSVDIDDRSSRGTINMVTQRLEQYTSEHNP